MEKKRWNPQTTREGKNVRPTCPHTTSNDKCLQNCLHLIEEDGLHGCKIDDEKTLAIAAHEAVLALHRESKNIKTALSEHAATATTATSAGTNAPRRGRPPKGE